MKALEMSLSQGGIEELLAALDDYEIWLKERAGVLLDRLAAEGLRVCSAKFAGAIYDGANDVSVSVEAGNKNTRAVIAVGQAALFIEFGTGVTYSDNHPEAGRLGMNRGAYGAGHGKQTAWGYYGEPGSNGKVQEKASGRPVVITHGNPANMAMYVTVKELEGKLGKIAREVFQ